VYGCETDFYELDINQDYHLDMDDFIAHLSDTYDIVILGNPNNPTSQLISKADIEKLAAACKELDIALLLDEMYIEFTENYERNTAISLVNTYDNLIILRSVSKFFSVPGLRLAYAIMNNETNMTIINMTATPNSISCLTAAACTAMLEDTAYIHESHSRIFTERNLIYSAMNTNKNLRLFKPSANFVLMQILKEDVTAKSLLAHCNLKGIVLRNCENFHGLDSHFVRFSIMNPMQNDLMVNTILELLR
jgi:threonine-phosphate decarboxylase